MSKKSAIRPWFVSNKKRESFFKNDTFYDVNDFPFKEVLEKNYPVILEEINSYLKENSKDLKPYFNATINQQNKWKAISFYFWGIRISKKATKGCPQTVRILKGIPNLLSASISLMEPFSEIKPHFGDTDSIYRFHFGLAIPGELPQCGIQVGYESKKWENGKLLAFNDAAYHKAWNNTSEKRVILIFDVLRPEFVSKKKTICLKVYFLLLKQYLKGIFSGKKNSR